MRTSRILAAAVLTLALVVGGGLAGGALKSGPQTGEKIPGPFHPVNITGKFANEKHCLVCEHGTSPVAMVFAREVSAPLTKLIHQLDAATAKNSDKNMGSFVVFLSDKEGMADQLKKVAADAKLQHTVLAIDNPAGPEKYNVARDAEVTVVLYSRHNVLANHTFRKGQLNDAAITRIMSDVPKILP
jgi:uncharacterized protein YbaA (DUF1428 family)